MLMLLTLPIAVIDTMLLYRFMAQHGLYRDNTGERLRMMGVSLMRFTFAAQLVVEMLTGNKTLGGIFSVGFGMAAGLLSSDGINLGVISDILMNVFMGVSMGIFLIGHMPTQLTLLLLVPVLLSSGLTFLHTTHFTRRE